MLLLHCDRRGDALARSRERIEEGVAVGVDRLAPVAGEGLAHQPPMRRQQLRIAAVPQPLEQAGAALDVAEQERDRPGWQVRHGDPEDTAARLARRWDDARSEVE